MRLAVDRRYYSLRSGDARGTAIASRDHRARDAGNAPGGSGSRFPGRLGEAPLLGVGGRQTADVRAVDAMPPGLDPSGAVAAAKAWTFEPARENGVPIEWHNNIAVISFSRPEAVYDGSMEFAEAYEHVES